MRDSDFELPADDFEQLVEEGAHQENRRDATLIPMQLILCRLNWPSVIADPSSNTSYCMGAVEDSGSNVANCVQDDDTLIFL